MNTMWNFLKSFKEVRKHIRRGPPSINVVKVCPICLSKTIEVEPNDFLAFLIPSSYHCLQCNYKGPILAEIDRDEYEKIDFDNLSTLSE